MLIISRLLQAISLPPHGILAEIIGTPYSSKYELTIKQAAVVLASGMAIYFYQNHNRVYLLRHMRRVENYEDASLFIMSTNMSRIRSTSSA